MGVKKLPSGRWQADAELQRGKRVRRTFERKADALRFEASIRSKSESVKKQLAGGADRRKLSDVVTLWYDLHGHTLNDGQRRYRALQRLSVRLGNPVASKLSAGLVAKDRRQRSEQGLSDKTLNNELTYLRAVFNELCSLGELSYSNPLTSLKQIRIQEQELSWLTLDQIDELYAAVASRREGANPHLEILITVCLSTGARWSEAESLKPSSLRNGAVVFSNTKSGKVRVVPVGQSLIDQLEVHWRVWGPFTSTIGAFRRALEKTAIELPDGQASHVLRHTFASHFMMNGGNILTLQRILGHSSVKVTMRYAHLAPDHLRDAIKYGPLAGRDTLVTLEEKTEGYKRKTPVKTGA